MARETAVTEQISYATEYCGVCGVEVAMADLPADSVDLNGYAVVLGEGSVTRESEEAGNWDAEVRFELSEDASDLPEVTAAVVCEECAETIHGISPERTPFTGSLPAALVGESEIDVERLRQVAVYAGVAIVVLGLLVLLL